MRTSVKNAKGQTMLELLIAMSLSTFMFMVSGSMGQMTQNMIKSMDGDSLTAYMAIEQLSRTLSRSRELIVPSANAFKARLDYSNATGAWKPLRTPSDPSDDTWISVKWFGDPVNKIYYFYSTGAAEPRQAATTDQVLTPAAVTACTFSLLNEKLLHWEMTIGSNSPSVFQRDVLASEMT